MSMLVNEDFETILICAERYALGRQTYMPGFVIDYITPLIKDISDKGLMVLRNDIQGAKDYGSDKIDKPLWMSFLNKINEELNSRKEGE